jgi:hypothetical protein
VKQISRARDAIMRNSISIDYLKRLNERYEAWIQTYDKGKLLDHRCGGTTASTPIQEDLGKIISGRIDAEIHGLFPMETTPVKVLKAKATALPPAKSAAKTTGKGVTKKR